MAWDFTCINCLAKSYYANLLDHVTFEPVAMESLGGVGVSSLRFIRKVSRRIDENIQNIHNFIYAIKF